MDEDAERLGGYPFGVFKKRGRLVLRFYPKSQFALSPDRVIFSISLDANEVERLKDILSGSRRTTKHHTPSDSQLE